MLYTLHGSGFKAVHLGNYTIYDFNTGMGSAWAGIEINSSGYARSQTGSSEYTTLELWRHRGVSSDYDVWCTPSLGASFEATSSAVNTWLNCGTTRHWTITRLATGFTERTVTLKFRYTATQVVIQDNIVMTLQVEHD